MPVNPAVVTLTEWFVLDKRLLSHIKRTVDNQKNVFISNVVMGYRHMSDIRGQKSCTCTLEAERFERGLLCGWLLYEVYREDVPEGIQVK